MAAPFLILCVLLAFQGQRVSSPDVASQDAGFERLTAWASEGSDHEASPGGELLVRRGTVRTRRVYTDYVLQFEFRLPERSSAGRLLLRSRFDYGRSERGYRVALTNKVDGRDAAGRVSPVAVGMKEVSFAPVPAAPPADGWRSCEVRSERDRLTVSINGVTVSTIQALDEYVGHIALQAAGGNGIEFRNLQLRRLPQAREPFGQDSYRISDSGIEAPTLLKGFGPFYPKEPHAARIEGTVEMEAVVEVTGQLGDIRVVKSLHPDLDEAAIAAARRMQFAPGRKSGQPVPVIVTVLMEFRLHDLIAYDDRPR